MNQFQMFDYNRESNLIIDDELFFLQILDFFLILINGKHIFWCLIESSPGI